MVTQTRTEQFKAHLKRVLIGAVEASGQSARQVSIAVVGHDGLIRDIKAGRLPSPEKIEALCEYLGFDFYIGPPREPQSATEMDGHRFATVARFDAKAAAGGGHINFDDDPVDHLAFSRDWLVQNGIRPDTCFLISAHGESMSPTISDGDLIMIDRRKTAITSGRVYVFNQPGEGTRLKRIELAQDAALILRSDNPDQKTYPPEYLTGPDMNAIAEGILGEVIWSGHTWR